MPELTLIRNSAIRVVFALLVGFLFLLPHLVRVAEIGSFSHYTPFAAQSPSSMTWDETFLYGPEANYMLQRHALASDTDTWEHRDQPFPYSVLPAAVEAGIAYLVGSLLTAQILCAFLFPAITAWLLMSIFAQTGVNVIMSSALALVVLAMGFSPRTVPINIIDLVRHGLHGGAIHTMQAARNPNPNMSFPLLLGAILCLSSAIRLNSPLRFLLAGILGGLQFYAYTYYAIGWTAAIVFLCICAALRPLAVSRRVVITLAVTAALSVPFFWWSHLSRLSGGYLNRAFRLGMVTGHLPSRSGVLLTIAWGAAALITWAVWQRINRNLNSNAAVDSKATFLVILFCVLGGLAGMNMQLVTGFNVQETHHFPHMILQPLVVLMICILTASSLTKVRPRISFAAFAAIYLACAAAQVEGAASTASVHRFAESDKSLFAWLNGNSETGAVVATTDLSLATVLPLYTHDGTLLANGSRTSATNQELMERFLLANKLVQAPDSAVRSELSQGIEIASPAMQMTYSAFLYETAPQRDPAHARLTPEAVDQAVQEYKTIDLAYELLHLRVDYVWLSNGTPATIAGYAWSKVFENSEGSLWQISKKPSN